MAAIPVAYSCLPKTAGLLNVNLATQRPPFFLWNRANSEPSLPLTIAMMSLKMTVMASIADLADRHQWTSDRRDLEGRLEVTVGGTVSQVQR